MYYLTITSLLVIKVQFYLLFQGIFVTKVQHEGPASVSLQPGDKLLEVRTKNVDLFV